VTFYMLDVPEDTSFQVRQLRDAGTRLRNVAKLWRLLGSNKEQLLLSFLDDVPERDEDGRRVLSTDQVVRLLDGLRGIQAAAMARFTDKHGRIRTDAFEEIQREAPELITWDELADKTRLPTLNIPLGDAMDLDGYLREALGRPSRIGVD
jgi:hypothetical protein